MSSKIKFGLIGCGRIAQRHAEHISSRGALEAVCDVVKEKANDLGQKYQAKPYYDIDEFLASEKDIDVVSICSPNGLHAEHAIKALAAGVHVLCEKPMALSAHECGEMIKAAERTNKRLFAIKQNRFNPPVEAVKKLRKSGLLEALNKKVITEKTPVLGVCVGMQLLMEGSEEGVLPGLGWIGGRIVRFDGDRIPASLKIPHMGWSEVILRKPSRLFADMFDEPRFYFVHSYHPRLNNQDDALVYANHGYEFVAGMERENIVGVQFHPEKSHKFGMRLLENFVRHY